MDSVHACPRGVAARSSTIGAPKVGLGFVHSAAGTLGSELLESAKAAFPASRRLTTSSEFARVFAEADRSSDRYFTMLARSSKGGCARLGLTISRRAAKRAVDRNRLKRLARELFRQLELAPLDFVVIARGDAVAADSETVRRSLEQHFKRLSERAHAKRDG